MPSGEHVCGSLDPYFRDNTLEVVRRYKKLGGKIEVIVKKARDTIRSHPRIRGRSWTLSRALLARGKCQICLLKTNSLAALP
jgi:hypothetical protein